MFWLAASVCLLFGSVRGITAAASAGSFTVRLKPEASVKIPSFALADIADLSGDNEATLTRLAGIPLGTVMDTRVVSRDEVLSMIRSAIGNTEDLLLTGADYTRVSLATRTADAAAITSALKFFLTSTTLWREEEIEVRSIDNLKSIQIPDGDLQLMVVSRGLPSNFKSALLPVEVVLDGKAWRTLWVKADIRVHAQVVQVAKPVAFRGILKVEDLREQVCDIEDPRAEYFRTMAEAIGKTAKRALGPGELLSRTSVEEASLVRNGETVRLLVESGSLRMTAQVRALQNGKLGDAIKVRNTDTDRVITAVVTGRGEVRVGK